MPAACQQLSSSSQFRACESCLALPAGVGGSGCQWCGNTCEDNTGLGICSSNSALASPLTQCPQLLSATPAFAQSKSPTRIVINTSFLPPGLSFDCVFGTTIVPATPLNTTALFCTSPIVTSPGFVDLKISGRGTDGSSRLIAESAVSFEFYECPTIISQSCSPTCLASSSRCGWCVAQSSCTSQQVCIDNGVTDGLTANQVLWLNGPACPTVSDVFPLHVQVAQSTIDTPYVPPRTWTPLSAP
jgi:hypothetical protein